MSTQAFLFTIFYILFSKILNGQSVHHHLVLYTTLESEIVQVSCASTVHISCRFIYVVNLEQAQRNKENIFN